MVTAAMQTQAKCSDGKWNTGMNTIHRSIKFYIIVKALQKGKC